MKQRWAAAAVLLLGTALGGVREFLFINLNYQIDFLRNHRQVSFAHSAFREQVAGMDLTDLLVLKWVLASAFVLAMLGLCLLLARLLFGDGRYSRTIGLAFGAIGGLAVVLHLLTPVVPAFHGVSVKLLHLLQYPVVLVFIWAASVLGRTGA